jgi:hypothetical protein
LLPPIVPPPLLASKIDASPCTHSELLLHCFADQFFPDIVRNVRLPPIAAPRLPAIRLSLPCRLLHILIVIKKPFI